MHRNSAVVCELNLQLVICFPDARFVYGSAGRLLGSAIRTREECAVFACSHRASLLVSTFSRFCNPIPALMNSNGAFYTPTQTKAHAVSTHWLVGPVSFMWCIAGARRVK